MQKCNLNHALPVIGAKDDQDNCKDRRNDVRNVRKPIRSAFDVNKVRASHKSGLLEIVTQDALDEGAVRKALEPTGYTVLEVSSEPYVKKGLFGF